MTAPNITLNRGDADAIIHAIGALSNAQTSKLGDDEFAILPAGMRLESLKAIRDAYREKPERREGTIVLATEDSFVDIVNRYKNTNLTAIFARRDFKAASLLAVFDYHPDGISDVRQAEWAAFRAEYPFPLSKEWERWYGAKDTPMETSSFAAFVEDNLLDVVAVSNTPEFAALNEFAAKVGGRFASPTDLLEMSRSLQVSVASQVKNAITLQSGEIAVTYTEVHNDGEGKPIRIPSLFVIGIPIFVDGPRYRIPCRLRYRLSNGKVIWFYTLVKPEQSFDDAFKEVAKRVHDTTGIPLFYGEPEE